MATRTRKGTGNKTVPVRRRNGQFAPSKPMVVQLSVGSPPELEVVRSLDRVGLVRGVDYEITVEVETEEQWIARNERG